MGELEYTMVREAGELEELAAALEAEPAHALDSESNSGFVYDERLCLLQLRVGERNWLVDLPALPGGRRALDPIRPALESPRTVTWLHGGEFDVGCLKRDYDLALGGVWDSQQAATFLGWEKTGYAHAVERVCGVQVEKGYSRHDWGRRPIVPEALRYAVEDVLYLPRVCESLREEIRDADLEEELAIANAAVEEATWGGGYEPDGYLSLKGAARLPRSVLPVLKALFEWREETARRVDRPPGLVVGNRQLVDLARSAPSSVEELERLGLGRKLLERHGRTIARLVAEAQRHPPEVPPPAPRQPRDPRVAEREDALRSWRRAEARRREVPEQVVLPSAALRHLARHGAGDLTAVPQLGAKRIGLYGERLEALCAAD
ncbi:MAG: HRDC domain-containing protein [Thermoanaerobaculia bacterium]